MSPVRAAAPPRGPLYRLGRMPDPLAWTPWDRIGDGRFDDPQRQFRVLYAASQRRGAFVETLAQLRPSLEYLARSNAATGADEPAATPPHVPAHWYHRRGVARLRLGPRQRWLDLRVPETRETLRAELVPLLIELGLDLDLSGVVGPTRELTQAIARWAYERGYAGLAYSSRFDETLTLWAVFEGAGFEPVGVPEPIEPGDADLAATARLFGLRVSRAMGG